MRNHKTSTPVVRIYAQIRQTPGLSTVEIAQRLQLARTVVARWITELMLDGRIRKDVQITATGKEPPRRHVTYYPRTSAEPAVRKHNDAEWTPQPYVHPIRRAFLNNGWGKAA